MSEARHQWAFASVPAAVLVHLSGDLYLRRRPARRSSGCPSCPTPRDVFVIIDRRA